MTIANGAKANEECWKVAPRTHNQTMSPGAGQGPPSYSWLAFLFVWGEVLT